MLQQLLNEVHQLGPERLLERGVGATEGHLPVAEHPPDPDKLQLPGQRLQVLELELTQCPG